MHATESASQSAESLQILGTTSTPRVHQLSKLMLQGASHRFVSRQTALQVLQMEQTPASSIKLSLSRLRVMCVSGSNLHTVRRCTACLCLEACW